MGNTQLTIQVATSLPNAPHHLSLPFLLPLVIATLHPFQVPPSQKKNHHLEKQISQFRRNYVDVNLHVNPKNQCQPLDIHRIFSHLHRIPGLHETDHHNICSGTSSVNVPNEFHLANSELWNRSWEGVLGWDHKIMFEKYYKITEVCFQAHPFVKISDLLGACVPRTRLKGRKKARKYFGPRSLSRLELHLLLFHRGSDLIGLHLSHAPYNMLCEFWFPVQARELEMAKFLRQHWQESSLMATK